MALPTALTWNELHGGGTADTSSTGIAVDSNTLKDAVLLDMRPIKESIIQIINKHASNSLDYAIYGNNKEDDPPDFSAEDWNELKASTSVAIDTNAAETLTDKWAWLLIRLKRTSAGNDSTADILVQARQS